MSYRLPAHLHRNRHGTLYFRLSVPEDLRQMVGQGEIYRSLNTSSVRQAADAAQTLRIELWAIFRELREEVMPEQKKDAKTLWDEFVALPDLRQRIKMAGMQAAIEDQQAQLELRHDEIAELCARHERDLQVVARIAPANTTSVEAHQAIPGNRGKNPSAMTVMQVFEEFKALQIAKGAQGDIKGGWSNPKRVDVEQTVHVRAFIDFLEGDCPIEEVSDDDVMAFNDFVMTTDTIKSASMRKQRLNRTAAAFKYAKKRKYILSAYTDEFRFDGQIKKNPYLKFTNADLKALFESDAYRNHQHETTSQYWLPLLGLHTGARLNELCQLLRSDIKEIDGIPVISILDEEENKRLKTEASRRIVPIHSKLIELGFLDFVRAIPRGRIFHHLREDPLKPGDYGQKASEDFTEYRRSVGVGKQAGQGKSNKAFHSFRTTFINAMRHARPEPVPKDRRTRLVGHEYEDTHDDTYDGGDVLDMFPIETLKSDVERVCFDVTFTPYRLI